MGRHKAKAPRKFGMAHGKHMQCRNERVQEAKVGRKSFKYTCERQENNKITFKVHVQQGIRRRKSRFLKKRGMKRYYQFYRSPFTGQLKKESFRNYLIILLLSLHHPLETSFLNITLFLNTHIQI